MGEPLRINCPGADAVPSGDELLTLVTRERHVLLEFPPFSETAAQVDESDLIRDLTAALPEDFHVFGGGARRDGSHAVTIMQVIPRAEALAHADELVAAGRLFGEIA